MKIAIDPGHGLGNSTPGLFDPGATNQAFREADIVLTYAHALDAEARARGWQTYMTRRDNETPAPLNRRVRQALAEGATTLISLHCNAFITGSAHGTETLYQSARGLAGRIQQAALGALGLTDRGIKHRPNLAILRFNESVLLELGFISNPYDLARLMEPESPAKLAAAICDALDPHTAR